MPNLSHCAWRHTEILRNARRFAVGVEREEHDQPVALGQRGETLPHSRRIQRGHRQRLCLDCSFHELRRQRLPTPRDSAFGMRHHPARPQNKGADFLRSPHFTGVQPLYRQQQDVLRQVVSGRTVPQMTTAVEPHAWRKAAIQFSLFEVG